MKWVVTSAWPYAHGTPHLGNIVSSLLSADVFNRYLRLKGYETIMVSGSDEHGSPIEIKAIKLGLDPKELTDKVHQQIKDILKGFNIEFDNYTRTHNTTHIKYVQEVFRKIYNNGYIFSKYDELLYCPKDKLFLPDRFVIGTCPHCGYDGARGDQCENCGKLLDPLDLLNPRCSICDLKPTVKKVKHYYFDLPKFSDKLYRWIKQSKTLSDNSKNFSLQMIKQGLKARSITRNNKWGVPAPFPDAEDLTIYVWFDAVLGYVSAVMEYFENQDRKDGWMDYWLDENTHIAFFIGKDNIPFHTIIFPSLLMATHDKYTLNFHIGATEWLTFEGQKFSKTKGIGIWGDEAIKLLPGDYWRYTLIYLRPETRDTDFTLSTLEYCVNKELNDDLGNLVHRVLNLIKRYSNGKIEKTKPKTDRQVKLYHMGIQTADKVDKEYMDMRFQRVIYSVMSLVREANAIINHEKPWETWREEPDKVKGLLYILAETLKRISIMLYPIIPESSKKILEYLGLDYREMGWKDIYTPKDVYLIASEFRPIFYKIDKEEIRNKLKEIRGENMEEVDIETFQKLDLRVGTIVKALKKEGSKNLLRLYIDIGDRTVKVLAGLANYYSPQDMIGKKVIVITNLKKKKLMGEYSEGMILAADDGKGNISLLTVDGDIENGSKVR